MKGNILVGWRTETALACYSDVKSTMGLKKLIL